MADNKTKYNIEGLEEVANESLAQAKQDEVTEVLTDNQMQEVNQEIELEKEYGNAPIRTAIESGVSAATFGISDQAISKFGGEDAKKALRERRQRNEEAALVGEVAGVLGPALASGGTSLAAKVGTSGIKTAAKIGTAAEKLTAKQLAKIINETGKKKLAKEVILKSIPKTAGSAVEGSFYGIGELIKEDALGTAEFNAENLIASAGTGAMFGGAAGGLFGSAQALIPVIKNNKLVDVISKKINTNVDKRLAGAKLAKMTPSEINKLKDTNWGQQIYDNIPNYFTKNLNLKVTDNLDKLYKKSSSELNRLGNEIGETALKIDDLAAGTNLLPTKSKVALRVQTALAELEEQFLKNPDEVAAKSLNKIRKRAASWDKWLSDSTQLNATGIKELKTNLQKAAKWNRSIDQIPLDGKLDRKVAEAVRQEFMDLADNVSTLDADLGSKLRKLNVDYGTGLTLTDKLKKAVNKEATKDSIGFKDLLVADILSDVTGGFGAATGAVVTKKFLESDFKRKLTLLTNIEKANNKVTSGISKGLKGFFSKAKTAAVPTSTKVLMSTSFEIPDESGKTRKKPKNKKEALKNLADDLNKLSSNPEELTNYLAKNSLRLEGVAPQTASAMDTTLSSAIMFLANKIPKNQSIDSGLFKRPWEPSSIEVAKFERYLEAINNPMSIMEDLQSGSLTRESVEAVKAVYPDLYTRIQQEAINLISENQDVSYEKRLQIGTLLDINSDASLQASNITALQQTFADLEQQQNAARKEQDINPEAVQKSDKPDSIKSETQKVATRE